MPLYEYRCEQCGELFEVMQKFSDEPLTRHDKCGGVVERLVSAPALQFKGSGWYITDYAKGGSSSASGNGEKGKSDSGSSAKPSSESGSGTTASSSSSSDSKPSSDSKA
ncbi:MAG: zinc ribbon domain-containing protein [Acidobacteriaceae bacterium]|nr:zinc ribbon domain-containing protein [Acidobacteriaceae bacterium]